MALVIPVFIPHEGCPYRCLFCNQHRISGQTPPARSGAEIEATIRTWLAHTRPERRGQVEVAFYGGSFTCLPLARQDDLLAAVRPFRQQGMVHAIRLSTRPDAIDGQRLDLLVRHRVSIVELGAQSCDDEVLRRSGRGHDAAAIAAAVRLIRERDMRLGLQLMLGLPGENFPSLRRTANETIRLRPDFVRIYPALVLRGSGLERLYRRGSYRPLGLGRAVAWAAYLKKRFDCEGIGVVRMGLQASTELARALMAGPHHPAFGELVLARLMLAQTRRLLAGVPAGSRAALAIAAQDQSIFRGPKSANLHRLRQLGLLDRLILRIDPGQPRQTLRLVPENAVAGEGGGGRPATGRIASINTTISTAADHPANNRPCSASTT
ncbi:radical SAM protein [Desulfobulbus sp.]|uniref:elongator complex protein 3 n=1 Tax=Desulfobulbus sp. TaxID=895 RepID=UPI00286EF3C0|nr:radical SAM protein [Desulfobulbus sp.]